MVARTPSANVAHWLLCMAAGGDIVKYLSLRVSGSFAVALATVAGVQGCSGAKPGPVGQSGSQLSQTTFDPNDPMSDADLTGGKAITVKEMQKFLSARGSVLASFNENGQSAAEIIVTSSQKYGISPLYMLARIESEQGLVSATTFTSSTEAGLAEATGYSCPGSCDGSQSGFANQVAKGAQLIAQDLENAKKGIALGSGWLVNVEHWSQDGCAPDQLGGPSTCGCPVTPDNAATTALYSYTPYVGHYYSSGNCGADEAGVTGLALFFQQYAQSFPGSSSGGAPSDAGSSSSGGIQPSAVIARAMEWVNAKLQYCQSANNEPDPLDDSCSSVCHRESNPEWDPYRSDCSGFVTWAWGLPASGGAFDEPGGGYVTGDFAPYSSTSLTYAIDGSSLQPGDALNKVTTDTWTDGHIVIFKQWVKEGQSAVFMEEPGCSAPTPYASEFTSDVKINSGSSTVYIKTKGVSFTAIRYEGIASTSSHSPPSPKPAPKPAPTPTPPPTPGPSTPIVAMAGAGSAFGYWDVTSSGKITAHGDATAYGDASSKGIDNIVGIAATATGAGYWLAGAAGEVYPYGDAVFYGSMAGKKLNKAVVGIAASIDGLGYWLVAADGGVFAYGDAMFQGSLGDKVVSAPIVGMAVMPWGGGYWLVGSDGSVYPFGDAESYGSRSGKTSYAPFVGIAATSDGSGYWLLDADGGVFTFGDATFEGALGTPQPASIVGFVVTPDFKGYWIEGANGAVHDFGDAP
jgi:hypothetical protein